MEVAEPAAKEEKQVQKQTWDSHSWDCKRINRSHKQAPGMIAANSYDPHWRVINSYLVLVCYGAKQTPYLPGWRV